MYLDGGYGMRSKQWWRFDALVTLVSAVLCASGSAAPTTSTAPTTAPAAGAAQTAGPAAPAAQTAAPAAPAGNFQIPATEDGKLNVAMVLIGPHDDGGYSQAHFEGLQYIEK